MENRMYLPNMIFGKGFPGADSMVSLAIGFCMGAHHGQVRKYTGEPYHEHCFEVAQTLFEYGEPPEVVIAGLLHDVIEDTSRTYEDIFKTFGQKVADLVFQVTDISTPEDGNRAKRKDLDRIHLSKSSPEAANIKLADIMSNTHSIVQYDKGFAKIYIPEKLEVLKVLKHASNEWLYGDAETVVQNAAAMMAEIPA